MLQNLREHAQGWIAAVIAGVLCLAFALWGIQYYITGNSASDEVAKVNGEKITTEQWNALYKRVRQNMQLPPGASSTLVRQLKNQTLEQLITQTALAQAAYRQGYRISNAQISAIISQVPAFQVQGQFSLPLFQRLVAELFNTETAFLTNVRQEALILQARNGIASSNFALPNEIAETVALAGQTRDFGYLIIPATQFVTHAQPSEQAIQAYYTAHKKDFMTAEQVSLDYLELSAAAISGDNNVSDDAIKQYYTDNPQEFSTPEQWQIARIVVKVPADAAQADAAAAANKIQSLAQRVQAGEDFARVAMAASDDKATAVAGGMVGWINRAQQPAALLQAVASLQPGQVSTPFRTQDGYIIVKLIAVKKPQLQAFTAVRDQAEKALRQQKQQQLLADKSDQLANLTFTNPDSLQPAATALNIPVQTTAWFSRQGGTGIAANPKVIAAAFSGNVLTQRNNSDVISLDNQTLLVVRIHDYKPAQLRPLTEVRAQIETQLTLQSARQQAQAQGEQIMQALRQGTSLEQLATQSHLAWHGETAAGRTSANIPAEVLSLAFSLPPPVATDKPSSGGKAMTNGDYAVVAVSNVANAKPTPANAVWRGAMQTRIATQQGELDYYLYSTQQLRAAKIKREPLPEVAADQ